MKYDPKIHKRRSIRLKYYDYSQAGAYFITICTDNRKLYFDEYPLLKIIVCRQWDEIPKRYANISLDEFVIMPNHVHGIILVESPSVGAGLAPAPGLPHQPQITSTHDLPHNVITQTGAGARQAGARPAPTIGDVIGTFKSLCFYDWLRHIKENNLHAVGKFWQRNYYEHVVRNEDRLNKIREYIQNNPLKWQLDRENPARTGSYQLEDEIFVS